MSNNIEQQIAHISIITQEYTHQERELIHAQAVKQKKYLEIVCLKTQHILNSFIPFREMNLKFKGSAKGNFSQATGWKFEFIKDGKVAYNHKEIGSLLIQEFKSIGKDNQKTKEQIKIFQTQINDICTVISCVPPVSAYTLFEISHSDIKIQVQAVQNGYKIGEEI